MKHYLGDGCYVDFDGYSLVLTTENGIAVTNRIVLESEVYSSLVQYVDHLRAIVNQPAPDTQTEDEQAE